MTRKRMLIYGAIALVLIIANVWRLFPDDTEVVGAIERREESVTVPDLVIVTEASVNIGTRDLFAPAAASAPEAPKPVVETPKPIQQPPDPREIAKKRAIKDIGEVRLIGVLGSSTGALAVLEKDGNTLTRAVGEEVIPGFKVDRIVRNEVRARHDKLGLIAVLTLGGSESHQIIRVD